MARRYEFYVRVARTRADIKFISSSERVMFFLLHGEINSTKAKGGNRDDIERYDTHKGDATHQHGSLKVTETSVNAFCH